MKNSAQILPAGSAHIASPLLSVSATLAGIIVLILCIAWLARRFGLTGVRASGKKTLHISASVNLGPRERIVIVDVEDARLVLGVTNSQITPLHTLPPASKDEVELKPAPQPDFQNIMKKLLKRSEKAQ